MNPRFRQYVTDVAFRLTLGKTQITAMAAVKNGDTSIVHTMGTWVPAIKGLEDRGLVVSLPIYDTSDGRYAPGAGYISDNLAKPFKQRHRLTEEGEIVWKLLVAAGLVSDVVKQRKAANA